jgi:hypothetical protein
MGKPKVIGDKCVPLSLGLDQIPQGMPQIEFQDQNSAANAVMYGAAVF